MRSRMFCLLLLAGLTATTVWAADRIETWIISGYGNMPTNTLVDEAGNRAPAVQLPLVQGPVPEDKPTLAPNGAGRADKDKPAATSESRKQ